MFSKATLLGTFAGFLVYYMLAWLFYGFLAQNFFEAHNNVPISTATDHLFISLGTIIQSYVIANLYRKVYEKSFNLKTGFIFGTAFGLFVGFGIGFLNHGTMMLMDITGTLVDGFWSILLFGIIGAAIGWSFKIATPKTAA